MASPRPRAPPPWPYGTEAEWRAWDEILARLSPLELPHRDQLRIECHRELLRIARCQPMAAAPKRPALVPVYDERHKARREGEPHAGDSDPL